MNRDSIIFLEHMLDAINNIDKFMLTVTKQEFFTNVEKHSAVVRQLEILGEAAKNLKHSFISKYQSIPWKEIIGLRDKVIHHYFGLDMEIIFDIVNKELPPLKKNLQKIIKIENEK
ncbi:DUF86 domain-containing protein [Candidatus Woesearchaeota archaeon]|nr:DUF86 domain-containing protein [Candidatus Woesearchaeota archaeon]